MSDTVATPAAGHAAVIEAYCQHCGEVILRTWHPSDPATYPWWHKRTGREQCVK